MATITTITYNGVATSITFTTLSSMAASQTVGAASLAVDNTTNKYVDAMVTLKIIYSAAIPFGTVWAGIGVTTDGTNYGNPYVGTDSAVTLLVPPAKGLSNFTPGPGGSMYFPTSQIFYAESMDFSGLATTPTVFLSVPSIASCIGSPNVMPQKWGMFALNMTNAAFAAACTASYTGITYTNT